MEDGMMLRHLLIYILPLRRLLDTFQNHIREQRFGADGW